MRKPTEAPRPKPNGYEPLINEFRMYCGGQIQEPYSTHPHGKVVLAVLLALKGVDPDAPTTPRAAADRAIAAVGGAASCIGKVLATHWSKVR